MGWFAGGDARDPFTVIGDDVDVLTQEHVAVDTTQIGHLDETALLDAGDKSTDFVHVAGDHHPGTLRSLVQDTEDATQAVFHDGFGVFFQKRLHVLFDGTFETWCTW
jgi:hypothetical protein